MRVGGSDFLVKLLKNCSRSVTVDGKPKIQSLANPASRSSAYGGGNMIEFFYALRWVLGVNYGPFLTDLSRVFMQNVSEFAALAPDLVKQMTAPSAGD
jgi:hypothetical protein